MPIFEVGYRHWEGKLRSPLLRCWSITRAGMSLAWRSVILRRILLFSIAPLLYFAPVFFFIGYLTDPIHKRLDEGIMFSWVAGLFGPEIGPRILQAPDVVRPAAWSISAKALLSSPLWLMPISATMKVGSPLPTARPPIVSRSCIGHLCYRSTTSVERQQ